MNSCGTCGRMMVAIFQTPKCEVCELGGVEPPKSPRYWAVCRPDDFGKDGLAFCSVFLDRDVAAKWLAYRTKNNPGPWEMLPVETVGRDVQVRWSVSKHPVIEGARCQDTYAFASRDKLPSDAGTGWFVVVKP